MDKNLSCSPSFKNPGVACSGSGEGSEDKEDEREINSMPPMPYAPFPNYQYYPQSILVGVGLLITQKFISSPPYRAGERLLFVLAKIHLLLTST